MGLYLTASDRAELERIAAERRAAIERQARQTLQRLRDRIEADMSLNSETSVKE
jgi:hypothetical protein